MQRKPRLQNQAGKNADYVMSQKTCASALHAAKFIAANQATRMTHIISKKQNIQ